MREFHVTQDVLDRIGAIEIQHFQALDAAITQEFPDQPDAALAIAIGVHAATLLNAHSDPDARQNVVNGINIAVKLTGYELTPIT